MGPANFWRSDQVNKQGRKEGRRRTCTREAWWAACATDTARCAKDFAFVQRLEEFLMVNTPPLSAQEILSMLHLIVMRASCLGAGSFSRSSTSRFRAMPYLKMRKRRRVRVMEGQEVGVCHARQTLSHVGDRWTRLEFRGLTYNAGLGTRHDRQRQLAKGL